MRHLHRVGEGVPDVIGIMEALSRHAAFWKDDLIALIPGSPEWKELPVARAPVFNLMRMIEGVSLKHAGIVRVPPRQNADMRASHMLVLWSAGKTYITNGDETVPIKAGDMWMPVGSTEFAINNTGDDDLIVMCLDIGC